MTPPLTPAQIAHEDRRRSGQATCKLIDDMDARLIQGDARMSSIEAKQDAHSKKLDANSADTAEILEIVRMGKSLFRFAGWFGGLFKWTLGIAVGISTLWALVWPKK